MLSGFGPPPGVSFRHAPARFSSDETELALPTALKSPRNDRNARLLRIPGFQTRAMSTNPNARRSVELDSALA